MKRGFTLLVLILLFTSTVSAAGLFDGSVWEEWVTGNQILKIFKRAPVQTQEATKTTEPTVLANVYLEPATTAVSAEEYNRLLRLYELSLDEHKRTKTIEYITRIKAIDFTPQDYTRLKTSGRTGFQYVLFETNTGNYGGLIIKQGTSIPNIAILYDKKGNIQKRGSTVDTSFIRGALNSLEAQNRGNLLTKECGVGQGGVGTLTRFGGDGFKPGTDQKTANRNQQAPSAEEIRNAQRFGPSGSKVNTGPTGFVTQVNDPGSAAERQGCSNAQQRYQQQRIQQLEAQRARQQEANKGGQPRPEGEVTKDEEAKRLYEDQAKDPKQVEKDEKVLKELEKQAADNCKAHPDEC